MGWWEWQRKEPDMHLPIIPCFYILVMGWWTCWGEGRRRFCSWRRSERSPFRVISEWMRGLKTSVEASQWDRWTIKYERTILPCPICNLAHYFLCFCVNSIKQPEKQLQETLQSLKKLKNNIQRTWLKVKSSSTSCHVSGCGGCIGNSRCCYGD